MGLWKYSGQRLILGIPLGPNEEAHISPENYAGAYIGKLEFLVEEAVNESGEEWVLNLLDSYWPGFKLLINSNPSPGDMVTLMLDLDYPNAHSCSGDFVQLLKGEVSLEEYKENLGLPPEDEGDFSREEAEEEVSDLDLWEFLNLIA